MGIFDNLRTIDKIRLIDIELNSFRFQLYALLIQLGIEPDTFDENSWDTPLNMEEASGRVAHYINLINALEEKKSQLT
jgi:hypothetical protein